MTCEHYQHSSQPIYSLSMCFTVTTLNQVKTIRTKNLFKTKKLSQNQKPLRQFKKSDQ